MGSMPYMIFFFIFFIFRVSTSYIYYLVSQFDLVNSHTGRRMSTFMNFKKILFSQFLLYIITMIG